MSLENEIIDIQEGIRNHKFTSEQSISQGILLRLLSALDWPIYDTQIVIPEYDIGDKRRVDFALCTKNNKPMIFIEGKKLGNTDGADRQVFEYAFHSGIPLAIVTDGKEWHFYLPAEPGNYDERRVYKLDLIEREVEESSYRLKRYIGYDNVCSGNFLENAREDYRNVTKERQAKASIPTAWNKLLDEEDEMLLEIVSGKVESLCGYEPTKNQILNFLQTLQAETSTINNPPEQYNPSPHVKPPNKNPIRKKNLSPRTKIKVIFPDNVEICDNNVAKTMVGVIKKIGPDRVRQLGIKVAGFDIVSNRKLGTYQQWHDVGPNLYLCTHSSTDTKLSQLNEINDALSLGLKILKV